MASMTVSMPFVRREKAESQYDGLSTRAPELRLRGVRLKREDRSGIPCAITSIFVGRLLDAPTAGRCDLFSDMITTFVETPMSLARHLALCGEVGLCEHGVKRRDDGHVEARDRTGRYCRPPLRRK